MSAGPFLVAVSCFFLVLLLRRRQTTEGRLSLLTHSLNLIPSFLLQSRVTVNGGGGM